MRTFVAITLPGELQASLKTLIEKIKQGTKGASWVRPENIHLTLKFLGEIDPAKMGGILAALKEAARGVNPFVLIANGLGGFPNLKRPRVLWVGLGDSHELKGLHKEIDFRLGELGFERDGRAFNPHLTLCRLKTREASTSAARLVSGVAGDLSVDFRVDSFVFFKSVLSPKGAEHTPLETIRLEG